jgi:hypothetical protein
VIASYAKTIYGDHAEGGLIPFVGTTDQTLHAVRGRRQALRNPAKPSPTKPSSIIAQVEGSGTTPAVPMMSVKLSASAPLPHVHL